MRKYSRILLGFLICCMCNGCTNRLEQSPPQPGKSEIAISKYQEFLNANNWDGEGVGRIQQPISAMSTFIPTKYTYYDSFGDDTPELHVTTTLGAEGYVYYIFAYEDDMVVCKDEVAWASIDCTLLKDGSFISYKRKDQEEYPDEIFCHFRINEEGERTEGVIFTRNKMNHKYVYAGENCTEQEWNEKTSSLLNHETDVLQVKDEVDNWTVLPAIVEEDQYWRGDILSEKEFLQAYGFYIPQSEEILWDGENPFSKRYYDENKGKLDPETGRMTEYVEVDYEYRADGTLSKIRYDHDSYYYGTAFSSVEEEYDEQERLVVLIWSGE